MLSYLPNFVVTKRILPLNFQNCTRAEKLRYKTDKNFAVTMTAETERIMKTENENKKPMSLTAKIMAGFLALLMLAGSVFGVLYSIIG